MHALRPTVGDVVALTPGGRRGGCLASGEMGTIVRDAGASHVAPYVVRSATGGESWYAHSDIFVADRAPLPVPQIAPPLLAGSPRFITYNLCLSAVASPPRAGRHSSPLPGKAGISLRRVGGRLVVSSVAPGSAAHLAGITPGAVVARIAGMPVTTASEARSALAGCGGSGWELTVDIETTVRIEEHPTLAAAEREIAGERLRVLAALRAHELGHESQRKAKIQQRHRVGSPTDMSAVLLPLPLPSEASPTRPDPAPAKSPDRPGAAAMRPADAGVPAAAASAAAAATPSAAAPLPEKAPAPAPAPDAAEAAPAPTPPPPPEAEAAPAPAPAASPADEVPPPAEPAPAAAAEAAAADAPDPPAAAAPPPDPPAAVDPPADAPATPAAPPTPASPASPPTAPEPGVPEFQRLMISAHDAKRAVHDACPVSFGGSLAENAQRQADVCLKARAMSHGNCDGEGQNIYMQSWSGSSGPTESELASAAVDAWYSEIEDYLTAGGGVAGMNNGAGHFTQLVWKGSDKIGAAVARADGIVFVVVNYGPPGNLLDDDAIRSNVST